MSQITGPMRDTFAVAAILYEALTGKLLMNQADMELNAIDVRTDLMRLRQKASILKGADSVLRPSFDHT